MFKVYQHRDCQHYSLTMVSLHQACCAATSSLSLCSCRWAGTVACLMAYMALIVGSSPGKGVLSSRSASCATIGRVVVGAAKFRDWL